VKIMKKIFITLLAGTLLAVCATSASETNEAPTLTLANAHELALKNHPQIAAADYRALAAQEVIKESRAAFFRRQTFTVRRWALIPLRPALRPVA
jgi:outer membrane protein TolC